ncbi:tRNA pseudouridine synthase A [Pilimelia anulata]|uniref:tRNA pseudouridine synthase A n=1 Tax=Pilimelia anulata TaxID=53371 RepID=A0A8J3BBG2_9ACTN|nr:tRNA pseudouridine(38-40) synthase TruA [Pilimelia anulata]GGJ98901.1 tRNA pseudouridine synthase A [Pilimelia anulata]
MRVRLDVSYDGTDFAGWAVQPEQRTVAGVLGDALRTLYGVDRVDRLTVAGRTDAGVHATGQVCHLDLDLAELPGNALHRLNRFLPDDVRVRALAAVPASFDARFSATHRRYEYRVTDAAYGAEPLRRRDTVAWPRPLDADRLAAASAGLLGEHDFAAYCRRKDNATTIRALTRLDWRRDGDILLATVQADAFCQAMVRSLVGALLPVGDGRRGPDWPASLLGRAERAGEVTVAPAHGLTLVEVGYPDAAEYAAQDARTRRLRTLPAGTP